MAADIALAGMDPIAWLASTDQVQVMVQYAVARRHLDRLTELQRNLAHEIVNLLAKSFNKKG